MKNRNIGLGVGLIAVGAVWLLQTMGLITFNVFNSIAQLWPLILVVIGINIIFRGNDIVRLVTWMAFFAAVIIYGYYNPVVNNQKALTNGKTHIIEKLEATDSGFLKINAGASELNLKSGTENLMEIWSNIPNMNYSTDYDYGNGNKGARISVGSRESGGFWSFGNMSGRRMELSLNQDVVWDVDVDFGAGASRLDFSDVKLGKADLDIGAGSLTMYVGSNNAQTDIKLDAGASSIELYVPKTSGVVITAENALSSINIDQLDLIKEGKRYTSRNYDEAESKIDIDLHMGMGSFELKGI